MHVPTKENLADILSRGCSSPRLLTSNWIHLLNWLLTQYYSRQEISNIVVTEIVSEINLITAVEPIADLCRFSELSKVLWVMTLVLKFIRTNTNPSEALAKQEQQLHTNSIY